MFTVKMSEDYVGNLYVTYTLENGPFVGMNLQAYVEWSDVKAELMSYAPVSDRKRIVEGFPTLVQIDDKFVSDLNWTKDVNINFT